MTTAAPLRLPRALVLAGTTTAVGAASHLLTGGALTVAGVVVAVPMLLALAWPLTGRERGPLAILGVQLAGQQAAHVLFGLGAGPPPASHTVPTDAWFYGHVLVAVAVAAWLHHGERRTWAAARRAATAVAAFWQRLLALVGRPDAPAGVVAPASEPAPVRLRHPLRHSVHRRGPPLLAA